MITIHPRVREEYVFRDSIVYSDRVSRSPDVVSYSRRKAFLDTITPDFWEKGF